MVRQDEVIATNRLDLEAAADNGLSPAMIDRLTLTEKRIADSSGAAATRALPDPVGRMTRGWPSQWAGYQESLRADGVVGIIFESRPNVTVMPPGCA